MSHPMSFTAILELAGKTATGIQVPDEVVEKLGGGKRPPVRVSLNGYVYRTTVAPMGGTFFIPVAREIREGAGLTAGETVQVEMTLDTEPRTVEVPADFQAALDAAPGANEKFEKLSYTHRKEHVRAIEDAKTPETRARRIAKAIEMLSK
jgi:hypothetical protein